MPVVTDVGTANLPPWLSLGVRGQDRYSTNSKVWNFSRFRTPPILYSRIILALLNQFKSLLVVTVYNDYYIQILKLESKIIEKITAR